MCTKQNYHVNEHMYILSVVDLAKTLYCIVCGIISEQ